MADERWVNPFNYSMAYVLFMKHFTELNKIYWAHIPARNTIQKQVKVAQNEEKNILDFFIVRDEDDRRVASTYSDWIKDYNDFDNYTRLNMLMLLSSSFETYLRTIVSLAVESKPGLLLKCPNAIDGIFLLRQNSNYGDFNDKNYQFNDIIDEVCSGSWQKRVDSYKKYFLIAPDFLLNNISELDELRQKRNMVGHYFGRTKQQYEIPILLQPQPAIRVSHEKLLKYFSVVHKTVKSIDKHLLEQFIGSYDVLKFYKLNLSGTLVNADPGAHAKALQKYLGKAGLKPVGSEYYKNLLFYYNLKDKDEQCRYSSKVCIKEIKKILNEAGVVLYSNGNRISFNSFCFSLFSKKYGFKDNKELCVKYTGSSTYFLYSTKTIELIVEKIKECPEKIIDNLNNKS